MGAFDSLRYRDYRLMWAGSVLSNAGTWMMWVALSWHVFQLTHSAFWVGAINFANFFPMWLSPLGGVLADRFDRKKVLLVTQTIMMVDGAALAVLAQMGRATLVPTFLLTLVLGFTFAADAPARHAFFPSLVPREAMVNAIALNSAQFSLARVVGPAIAGPLVATVGVTPVFWINAVSFAFVLGALWLVRSPYQAAAPGKARASLAEGVRYAWRHPVVRTLLIAIAVYSLFGAPIQALLPVFAEDVFDRGARAFGLLAAVMGAGSVLGALVLGRLGRVSLRMIGASLVLSGLALAGFAAVPWFSAAVPLMFLFGAAYLFMVSAVSGQLQTAVDDAVRGRVVSLLMMLFGGVFPVGSLIGGAVADRIGAQPTVLVGAAVVIAWGVWFGWRHRLGSVEGAPAALEAVEGNGERRPGRPPDDAAPGVLGDGRRKERHGSH